MNTASPNSNPDRPFGRYQPIALIARGGMGTVYLCRVGDGDGFRRLFALKVIHEHLSEDQDFIRLFMREAKIASRLHHPNVVGIVDVGSYEDGHFVVMDYVEGCTLSDLLSASPETRPPGLLVPIVLDTLNALQAAHILPDDHGKPLGLVHRDVSPQNILVGADGCSRLTDFGVAKLASGNITKSGTTRGKPAYMSPEQVSGGEADHRADIFSTGVVLWNALTGKYLFDGSSHYATMFNVLRRKIPRPSSVGLKPPACFDHICLKALQRRPEDRFQNAAEMAEALRAEALRHGQLEPLGAIAGWVHSAFGTKLEERRSRVREVAAGAAPAEVVRSGPITAGLVSLPSIGISPSAPGGSTPRAALLSYAELSLSGPESDDDFYGDDELPTRMYDPEAGMSLDFPEAPEFEEEDQTRSRRGPVLFGAAAVAMGAVAWLAWPQLAALRTDVSEMLATSAAAPAEPVGAPQPEPAASPASEPVVSRAAAPPEQVTAGSNARTANARSKAPADPLQADASTDTPTPVSTAPPPAEPTGDKAVEETDEAKPRSKPKKNRRKKRKRKRKRKRKPKPKTDVDIESNPYLQQ